VKIAVFKFRKKQLSHFGSVTFSGCSFALFILLFIFPLLLLSLWQLTLRGRKVVLLALRRAIRPDSQKKTSLSGLKQG
jgi:hypothetical protein